jgi:6-phosphogluconolactonase
MSAHLYPEAAAAAVACAERLSGVLLEALAGRGRATLAVSGGATPKLLFDSLAGAGLPWNRIHLFWTDERAVPPEDPHSNYRLAEEHLLRPAGVPSAQVHRIAGELPLEEAARLYTEELRDFFALAPGALPCFDAVHLGMGTDGHTASLFPGSPLVEDRTNIAAAVFHGAVRPPGRVTLLPGVLLGTRHTVFLVAGEDKAETIRGVFEGPYNPRRYPAQTIHRLGLDVEWFLDRAAGHRLLQF